MSGGSDYEVETICTTATDSLEKLLVGLLRAKEWITKDAVCTIHHGEQLLAPCLWLLDQDPPDGPSTSLLMSARALDRCGQMNSSSSGSSPSTYTSVHFVRSWS